MLYRSSVFSNRNYEVIWGDEGEVTSFKDRWSGGIEHYINSLYERVVEIHRVLKDTGSIYLHCDYHANTYVAVNVLDKIFGRDNFRADLFGKEQTHIMMQERNSLLSPIQSGIIQNHQSTHFIQLTSRLKRNM